MHELTVAMRLRQALEEELADEPDLVATTVRIRVGALSGVVPEALTFAWGHAVKGSSLLEASSLEIAWVDAAGHCPECGIDRTITNIQSFRCPSCESPIEQITGGDELDILTVDVRDPARDRL